VQADKAIWPQVALNVATLLQGQEGFCFSRQVRPVAKSSQYTGQHDANRQHDGGFPLSVRPDRAGVFAAVTRVNDDC
jgi:hypothetical protein